MKQLGLGRAVAIIQRLAAWPSRRTAFQDFRETCNRIDILPSRPERLMSSICTLFSPQPGPMSLLNVPCAQRYVLTPDIVHTLANDTFAQTTSNARFREVWSRTGLGRQAT
ncbi:hypothetical protein E4U47_008374 [Claviceps purpurea]|nr:hypothetical protein E4U47_008374 [Claviceps purpurea]